MNQPNSTLPSPPTQILVLSELLTRPIAGNHYQDHELIRDLSCYLADDSNSMADRRIALFHITNAVMGIGIGDISESDVLMATQYHLEAQG